MHTKIVIPGPNPASFTRKPTRQPQNPGSKKSAGPRGHGSRWLCRSIPGARHAGSHRPQGLADGDLISRRPHGLSFRLGLEVQAALPEHPAVSNDPSAFVRVHAGGAPRPKQTLQSSCCGYLVRRYAGYDTDSDAHPGSGRMHSSAITLILSPVPASHDMPSQNRPWPDSTCSRRAQGTVLVVR